MKMMTLMIFCDNYNTVGKPSDFENVCVYWLALTLILHDFCTVIETLFLTLCVYLKASLTFSGHQHMVPLYLMFILVGIYYDAWTLSFRWTIVCDVFVLFLYFYFTLDNVMVNLMIN